MRYRKLRKVRDEIRLLTIIDDASEPITCKLEHVSLLASPSYKALSYSWGDQNDTRPVVVNGFTMAITANLEIALRQFRGEGHSWIWIDALSINQSDTEEREEQVLRMGDIFWKASEVIAWLGPERWDSDRAMEFMKYFGKVAAKVLQKERMLDWGKPISREECRADDKDSWFALDSLFFRRYWTRLWIVQELLLAKRVILRCGNVEATSDDLLAAVWIANRRNFRPSFPEREPRQTHLRNIFFLFCLIPSRAAGETKPFQPEDILIALSYTQYHVATDLRDKVYGILALAADGAELVGSPRYGESTEDLYMRLTRNLILTRKRLDFISFKATQRSCHLNLPTWTLDLSRPRSPSDPSRPSFFHVPLVWPDQNGNLSEAIKLDHPVLFDRDVLNLAGIRLDVVDGFGVARGGMGGSAIVQPEINLNGYDSDIDMRYAIINSIFQLWSPIEDLVEGNGTAQLVRLGWKWLWQPNKRSSIVPRQRAILEFQDRNRDLLIAGRRLEDWSLDAPDNVPLKVWQKLWEKRKLRKQDLTNGVAKNLLVDYMFPKFQAWNGCNRKIVITEKGYVGSIHPQARNGDLICCLRNCWNPVVLRATDGGCFELIGDAEIHGFAKEMKGFLKLQKEIEEGQVETFRLV